MTFLITLFARWGLPERIRAPLATAATIVAAVALVLGAWNVWLHFHDRAVVRADRAKANAEAHETARRADEAAQGETDRVKTQVEDENERARDAAKDSSDPLADALRSLSK